MIESDNLITKIKTKLLGNKITLGLVVGVLVLVLGGVFFFQKMSAEKTSDGPVEEIDLAFDPEGLYAILHPRRDGNALVLSVKRTSSYDEISYDLAYTSTVDETVMQGNKILDGDSAPTEGGTIDRGVSGTIDTKEKKGEYEQEILFGSCSKNVCKYDQGVENGTLTMKFRKGRKSYRMITEWHMQQPDVALGVLSSGDSHFSYKTDGSKDDLNAIGFTIINDLTGVPKLPGGKKVVGKVYALNVPIAKEMKPGELTIELAENPDNSSKIYRFNDTLGEWEELDTQTNGSKLSSKTPGAGIFAVLATGK